LKQQAFTHVNQQMEMARQSLKQARNVLTQAMLVMHQDEEGVNLPHIKGMIQTLSELLINYDHWKIEDNNTLPDHVQRTLNALNGLYRTGNQPSEAYVMQKSMELQAQGFYLYHEAGEFKVIPLM